MLRIGFLPSDFNPMVLMLGEAEDFRMLAGVLRQFARAPEPVRLDRLGFCVPATPALTLVEGPAPFGVDPADGTLTWRLDPGHAHRFAAQLDALADPARAAGSELLECEGDETIPVKASRGEYTEDFLLGRNVS